MAKLKVQLIGRNNAPWLLLLAGAALCLAVSPGWAGQHPTKAASPGAKTTRSAGAKAAKTERHKSTNASAQRGSKSESSKNTQAAAGRRDPFKLPEIATGKGGPGVLNSAGGPLPPGVRGLVISQLRLEGVVREQVANKMIAVVTNDTRRAYFLTENESVYNGVVSKITPDAVYFKENVLDANGRVTTQEVVKRLGSAPGERR